MKLPTILFTTCVLLAAGCTTASGPTHNTDLITLPNGSQTYRVQCQGLFESGKTCAKRAEQVCGEGAVRAVSSLEPASAASGTQVDRYREMTFTCDAPGPTHSDGTSR
ncbi:hypothetical protein LMG29542_06613 [Paraburkholderia humisilvae]|uniref:Lipoprotein n=1 Tax=Paraburkholderia humisilvae TaxID=627669 RepID=A0A6J5F131_9BURK|nr:hypothetical protein LMG29542_06613 [Paraburkholderia humisilvae]